MPRMSKSKKLEWSFFLNDRGRKVPLRPRLQAEFPGGCRYLPALSIQEGKKGWYICVLPSRTRWNATMNTADTERK